VIAKLLGHGLEGVLVRFLVERGGLLLASVGFEHPRQRFVQRAAEPGRIEDILHGK
jgi:hypothetical protein